MTDICTLIQIESTTQCNAMCDFCPVNSVPLERPAGRMSDDLFHKIVDEGMAMGVREFLCFGNGEPLMDNRFFEWLDYLKDRDLRTTIFTNGSLLTKPKAERLLDYANIINGITFSFHGGDPDTYERVMHLNFEKTKQKITNFLALNSGTIPARVYLLDYDETHESVDAFRALWGDAAFVSQAYFSWGGLRNVKVNQALLHPPQPCQRLLHHMYILQDGQVCMCCMDYQGAYNFGNVATEPLSVLWERAQEWRERHKRMDFSMDLCRDCTLNRYGGF